MAEGIAFRHFYKGEFMEELMKALEMCVENDEAVKTGRLDQVISVEMVIVGCSS